MGEWMGSLNDARIFSRLDANSRYWQVKIDELNREKNPPSPLFMACTNSYRCHLNWKTPSATFQTAMDVILSLMKWQSALVYFRRYFRLLEKRLGIHKVRPKSAYATAAGWHYAQVEEVLLLLGDDQLPGPLYTPWKVGDCRNNNEIDLRGVKHDSTDEGETIYGHLQRLPTVFADCFAYCSAFKQNNYWRTHESRPPS